MPEYTAHDLYIAIRTYECDTTVRIVDTKTLSYKEIVSLYKAKKRSNKDKTLPPILGVAKVRLYIDDVRLTHEIENDIKENLI